MAKKHKIIVFILSMGVYVQYYYMSNIFMLPKWGLVLYRVCPIYIYIYIFMEVPSLGDVFYPRVQCVLINIINKQKNTNILTDDDKAQFLRLLLSPD